MRWIVDLTGLETDLSGNFSLMKLSYTDGATPLTAWAETAVSSGGLSARQADYFYRPGLSTGEYLYNPDGSPQLEQQYIQAIQNGDGTQSIQLDTDLGLDRVTLYYGYDAGDIFNFGLIKDATSDFYNAVEIYSWMTAEEVQKSCCKYQAGRKIYYSDRYR